jgi:Na+/proline symporter
MFSYVAILVLIYGVAVLTMASSVARRTHNSLDFILCGGRLSDTPLALSVAATQISGFVLWGLVAAAYVWGWSAIWIALALFAGAALNWWYVAPRLRTLSLGLRCPTLVLLLAAGAGERMQSRVQYSAVIIVVICFGLQSAAQLDLGAALLSAASGWDHAAIVWWSGTVVGLCVFMAGLWSITFLEAAQVGLAALAMLAIVIAAIVSVGGVDDVAGTLANSSPAYTSFVGARHNIVALAFVMGTLGIGLVAPGQPHLVHRFLAARDEATIARGRSAALGAISILMVLALATGLTLRAVTGQLDTPESFVALAKSLLSPWLIPILIVLMTAACIAPVGMQTLTLAASVAVDLRRNSTELALTWARLAILFFIIAICSWAIYFPAPAIDRLMFCWTALGTAFGPLVLVRLSGKRVRPGSVLGSMWSGFLLVSLFHLLPDSPGDYLERIIPFIVALGIALTGGERRRNPDRADRAQQTLHDRMPI